MSKKIDKAEMTKLKFDLRQEWKDDDTAVINQTDQKCDGLRFNIDKLASAFEEHRTKHFADIVHRVSVLEKNVRTLTNTVNQLKGANFNNNDDDVEKRKLAHFQEKVANLEN